MSMRRGCILLKNSCWSQTARESCCLYCPACRLFTGHLWEMGCWTVGPFGSTNRVLMFMLPKIYLEIKVQNGERSENICMTNGLNIKESGSTQAGYKKLASSSKAFSTHHDTCASSLKQNTRHA